MRYYSVKTLLHKNCNCIMISSDEKMVAYGTKFWFKNGLLHRDDGPAIEYTSGDTEWFREGKRHRENGPAISRPQTRIYNYFLNNKIYSKEEWEYEISMSEEDKLIRNFIE